MLSPTDALKIVLENTVPASLETIEYSKAFGRVLGEPIQADRALPPFDRVMMDGIAIKFESIEKGIHGLNVVGTQYAGEPPLLLEQSDGCIEIMTGAVLPEGANCIVPIENIEAEGPKMSLLHPAQIKPFQYIHKKGSDHSIGAELVPAGVRLTSRHLAVAASSGFEQLRVSSRPKIAVFSTGDELVDISEVPESYQIRRSNSYSLVAALAALGLDDVSNYHLKDDENALAPGLEKIIEHHDLILLSGGVSKGKKDYLPEILEKQGITKQFQWVKQRPGKPFWFGSQSATHKLVFALPGNPLSTLICFHRYVKPSLEKMLGLQTQPQQWVRLAKPFQFDRPLTCFLPVVLKNDEDGYLNAIPKPVNNSGDYASIIDTDGFIELPELLNDFPEGFSAHYFPWI